jgi:single-strand DNA-binding protein
MLQELTIIGNLGSDPELRYMQDGTPVCSFSIATNRKWKNQDGTQAQETVWFRASAWNRLAEVCNQYLVKGKQVYIKARLTPDRQTGSPKIWIGQDGKAHSSYEVLVQEIKFLDNNHSKPTDDDMPSFNQGEK